MPSNAPPKVMQPWKAAALDVLTLSLYSLRWYYRVNRELRDFAAAHGDRELADSRPVRSLLAVTIGRWLLVPTILSYAGFGRRLERCESSAALPARGTAHIVAPLIVASLAGLVPVDGGAAIAQLVAIVAVHSLAVAMAQARLNGVWQFAGVLIP